MPNSRSAGMTSASRLRSQSEYSLCSAETGCSAWARRILATPALGAPKSQRLALFDQIADSSGDIFDWNGPIDPVLVEEIDVIGLEPAERPIDGLADRLRPAVAFSADLPPPNRKPNLVAMVT